MFVYLNERWFYHNNVYNYIYNKNLNTRDIRCFIPKSNIFNNFFSFKKNLAIWGEGPKILLDKDIKVSPNLAPIVVTENLINFEF